VDQGHHSDPDLDTYTLKTGNSTGMLQWAKNFTPYGLVGFETASQLEMPKSEIFDTRANNFTPYGLFGSETASQIKVPKSKIFEFRYLRFS
jgi:hypothetical protein